MDVFITDNTSASSQKDLPQVGSGNVRILVECACRWSKASSGLKLHIMTTYDGLQKYLAYGLRNVEYHVSQPRTFAKFGVILWHIVNTVTGLIAALCVSKPASDRVVIISASEFVADTLSAYMLKLRFRGAKWIAGFYLFAPNPFTTNVYKGIKGKTKNLAWFISQKIIYWLVRNHAEMVLVTNELDRLEFIDSRLTSDKIIAVRGGVDLTLPMKVPNPERKKYDAVFIGRFHPQKGILQLLDIWKYVISQKKDARLAVIGVGDLENEVKKKLTKYELINSVTLFGFRDGIEKIRIFKDSKIVVEPSIYASGGMGIVEAMSCGLPGVCFDLPVWRKYFPKGMLRTPASDLHAFAANILKLLEGEDLYQALLAQALELANEWDWDTRAGFLLQCIENVSNK